MQITWYQAEEINISLFTSPSQEAIESSEVTPPNFFN